MAAVDSRTIPDVVDAELAVTEGERVMAVMNALPRLGPKEEHGCPSRAGKGLIPPAICMEAADAEADHRHAWPQAALVAWVAVHVDDDVMEVDLSFTTA